MRTISAYFEGGVFRPEGELDLPEGTRVSVLVPEPADDPVAIMKARFPESFGIMAPEDADELQRIIDEEFGQVNPEDWR